MLKFINFIKENFMKIKDLLFDKNVSSKTSSTNNKNMIKNSNISNNGNLVIGDNNNVNNK